MMWYVITCYSIIWYDMIWCNIIWHDIIWYDIIWCDVRDDEKWSEERKRKMIRTGEKKLRDEKIRD